MKTAAAKKDNSPVNKGDLVMVMSGKERGKTGKVMEILAGKGRVKVEKLNFVKRHAKPSQTNRQGGVVEKEASIHWSNVLVMCPKCNKPKRKRARLDKDGKKERVCVTCGEQL